MSRPAPESEPLQKIFDGTPLGEALGVDAAQLDQLRGRAEALLTGGKWAECIDALDLLDRLGAAGPFDALMRARCHRRLGQDADAARWGEVAQTVLQGLDARLPGANS